MIQIFDKFRKVIEKCNKTLAMISGLGVLVMGLILGYEVVMRYFFNSPTIWVQETAIYLYMWTMLVATSYTLQVNKHINVDIVIIHLPVSAKNVLAIVTSVVGAAFSAIVAVQAYEMIAATFQFGKVSATPLRVPMWIPQSALLIGFVLLTFQFIIISLDQAMQLGIRKAKREEIV